MKWNQHNPEGRGTPRVSDGWMRQFLRRELEQQAAMVVAVRERVQRDLESKPEGMPGKDTMRAAGFAQAGFKILADLELEHAKLELLAIRVLGRQEPMTDDEYQAKLEALGRDALRSLPAAERAQDLSVDELEAELARRRALVAG